MSNNWKYSSLGQRERLSLIRGGDADVYNTEKMRNSSLIKERSALGLSTKEIDEWEATIDNAFSLSQKQDKSGTPKFMSTKNDRVANAYNSYMRELRSEIERQTNEAFESAIKNSQYLAEFLANNGYSSKGTTAIEGTRKIDEQLSEVLSNIKKYYKAQSESARSRMFS